MAKAKSAPRKDLRKMLDKIDEFLEAGDKPAKNLWAVLTALRGPDNSDDKVKHAYTSRIRALAFPKSADACTQRPTTLMCSMVKEDAEAPIQRREAANSAQFHFRSHAESAFHALGVKTYYRSDYSD